MSHVTPAQVLPTNPWDEQIAIKNGHLHAKCIRSFGVYHNFLLSDGLSPGKAVKSSD